MSRRLSVEPITPIMYVEAFRNFRHGVFLISESLAMLETGFSSWKFKFKAWRAYKRIYEMHSWLWQEDGSLFLSKWSNEEMADAQNKCWKIRREFECPYVFLKD